jgi:hypothetical protein
MDGVTGDLAWETTAGTIRVRGHRFRAGGIPLAVFEMENIAHAGTDSSLAPARPRLVYLPQHGTRAELPRLVRLLDEYRQVVSIDYPGIGELKSDRLLLHTFSRYFMHDRNALPTLNVSLLRAYLRSNDPATSDLRGRGWASSFYGLVLKHLEPARVGTVRACGPPADELDHLAQGGKIPNLLLRGGLFSELTAAELAAALEPAEVDLTTGPCP